VTLAGLIGAGAGSGGVAILDGGGGNLKARAALTVGPGQLSGVGSLVHCDRAHHHSAGHVVTRAGFLGSASMTES